MPPLTSGARASGPAPAPPLLERGAPLQSLQQAHHGAGRSGGRIVLVSGEAGIGKSSLVQAFMAQLGRRVEQATGVCDPLHTPRALGPVRDLADQLLGPDAGDEQEARHFDGLMRRLARPPSGVGRARVLVLEDLHWVDHRSLEWLQFVGRRITQLPLLLIGTFRDDEVAATHPLRTAIGALPAARIVRIELQALSLAAVRQLGNGRLVDPEAVQRITGGNPFFITELLQSGTPQGQLPASVADAVNARLNRLPRRVQALIELAACSPAGTPRDALLAAPGDADPSEADVQDRPTMAPSPQQCQEAALDEAVQRRLLALEGEQVVFRHDLVRMAVRSRLSQRQLRTAHRHLLDALLVRADTAAVLDLIVHHARGAGAGDVLLRHAPQAARQAAAYGAHREAAQHLASALAAVAQAPAAQAAAITEAWAYEAGLSTGIDERVIAARKRAIELWQQVGRPDKVGENLAGLSRLHWYRGEAAQAQAYIEQAIELLQAEAPSPAKARALALRAQFCMLQDHMAEAIDWGEQAMAVAERVGDVEQHAHALNTVGSARLFRADRRGEDMLRRSLRLSLQHGLHEQAARAYTNLSECLIELHELDRAEALIAEGIAFDTAHDLDAWTYYLVGRKAQLRFEQARYHEALAIADGVLSRHNQTLLMRMPARIVRARTLLRLGQADAAAALAQALVDAEQIGEPQYLAALRVAQIEAAVLAGRPGDARAPAERIQAMGPASLSPRKWAEYRFWCRQAGMADQACGRTSGPAAVPVPQADEHCAVPTQAPTRGLYRAARSHPYGLTAKEQLVLSLLADGLGNHAIAQALNRSRRTVENHVSAILSKLQAANRLEVVLRVQSEPWILPRSGAAPPQIEGPTAEI